MRTYKIAAIGGDGIGPEVVEAGVQVLRVCVERDGGSTRFMNLSLSRDLPPAAER